jgi:hypothetical protein
MPPILPNTIKTQPQVAQIELLFRGPLIKGSQVETFEDLLTLSLSNAYPHKIVWVKALTANYYLANGDGTYPENWKPVATRAVVGVYNPEESYQTSEIVYLSGKLYSAKMPVPKNYSPLNYSSYWLAISGETYTYRYMFTNTTSVILYTEIRNPMFQIFIGDISYDNNSNPIIDPETGFIKIENAEEAEAEIVERSDLPPNNGRAYQINFYVDSQPIVDVEFLANFSGIINIK